MLACLFVFFLKFNSNIPCHITDGILFPKCQVNILSLLHIVFAISLSSCDGDEALEEVIMQLVAVV